MAVFYNQATLSYRGGVTNSNITSAELTETVQLYKTAVSSGYAPTESVIFAVSMINNGAATLPDLFLTDDLGGYAHEGGTVYPLSYVEDSLRLFVNGVPADVGALTVNPGAPLEIGGLTLEPGANAVLLYESAVTQFAPLGEAAQIENTVTLTGDGSVLRAAAVVPMEVTPELTISKAVSPQNVTSGGRITYSFVIQNSGAAAAEAADAVFVSDAFDPALSDLTVTLDGAVLTAGVDYTYDADGLFETVAGRITVPAATFAQNDDGVWVTTPGVSVLTAEGTLV